MRKVLLVFPVRPMLLLWIKTDFTSPVKQSYFITGLTREIPSGLDGSISPFRVANQNAGFALSSPLVASAMQARKKTVRIQISRPPIMQNGIFFPSRFDCDWRAPPWSFHLQCVTVLKCFSFIKFSFFRRNSMCSTSAHPTSLRETLGEVVAAHSNMVVDSIPSMETPGLVHA